MFHCREKVIWVWDDFFFFFFLGRTIPLIRPLCFWTTRDSVNNSDRRTEKYTCCFYWHVRLQHEQNKKSFFPAYHLDCFLICPLVGTHTTLCHYAETPLLYLSSPALKPQAPLLRRALWRPSRNPAHSSERQGEKMSARWRLVRWRRN